MGDGLTRNFLIGDFLLHTDQRRVLRGGEAQPLGARAFDLLLCLLQHRDRVVGKDELLALVWPGVVVEENNLTVQVSALRKLLGTDAITTVAGRGYRLTLPVATASPAAVASAESGERPSIAVLPFEVRGDDAALGFLADGLVEDVIAQLARVAGFLVISRSSSFEFRRRTGSLPDVALQLGVRYLVEGSVRQVGTLLRVSTQLVDAASSRVLWSGQLESERQTAGDLQADIVRGIITELEPELTRAEITLIRRRHPDNVDAWGHYRSGVGALALQGWTEAALAQACDEFGRAFAIDPGFALAVAHGAVISALGLSTGLLPDQPATVLAIRHAVEQALALDDGNSQVLGFAGCTLCDLGDVERGHEVLQQALAIDPSNAQAHVALGASQALQGQMETGIAAMRHGMRLSPHDRRLGFWGALLSGFLLRIDRVDEALAEAQASARRDPRLHLSRVVEAAALQSLGRSDAARLALEAARRLRPGLTPAEVQQVQGYRVGQLLIGLWPGGDTAPAH